jgi:protocatechuate 3,4-dioxygenase beta subunit
MLLSIAKRLFAYFAGIAVFVGCNTDTLRDDYRDSWAVVQGRVLDQVGSPAAGTKVWLVPVQPPFARGDTVTTTSDGSYTSRVTAFGVSSFRADVRVHAAAQTGASADTLITGLYVAERGRGGRPDTLSVNLRLRP